MNGFHFTDRMRDVCRDMAERLPELAHVDMSRVAVSFSQARKPVLHGLYAKITPMRFQGGALHEERSGRRFTVQRVFDAEGREQLYLLSFYLPRFMETDLEEKLVTVLHELWHISPEFNGDLRRFPGRCYAHTSSQQDFDREILKLARRWLAGNPPLEKYGFLRLGFRQLHQQLGPVYGARIRQPKLIRA